LVVTNIYLSSRTELQKQRQARSRSMSFEEGSRPLCGDKPGIVVVVELPAKPQ
jgi:hypothetical protein